MKNFRKYQKGFTLLELMIVVAIAGIIASIALPSYQEQVRKSKRSEAKVALLRVSQLQESFFVQNLSYAKDLKQLSFATVKMPSEKGLYEMQITSVSPAGCNVAAAPPVSCLTYELTATPVNGKGQELDHDCIGFRVDNVSRKWAKASLKGTGAKSFATTTASSPYQTAKAAECWNK